GPFTGARDRRGAESVHRVAGSGAPALELRDDPRQAAADPARRPAGAAGQAERVRAPAAQPADRLALSHHPPPPPAGPSLHPPPLGVAGATDAGLFTDGGVQRITEYSRGIPRVINTLCDHCLISGYADSKRRIDVRMVEDAIEYLEDGEQPRWKRRAQARLTP